MATSNEENSLRDTLVSLKFGRGFLARILFSAHATLCVYEVVELVDNPSIWFILCLLGVLYTEFVVVILYRKGIEWKWFSGCILAYLMVVVPTVWILEIKVLSTHLESRMNDSDKCGIPDKNDTRPKAFIEFFNTDESWSMVLQQLLIFVLIIGRWILPRGNITGDQLSQLLLMYVGSGADILEFSSEGLRLKEIGCDSAVIYTILTIWTCSLFQFTLPLTVKKRSRPRPSAKGLLKIKHAVLTCCATEIWAILVTVLLQDGPFLVVRLYLMIHKKVVNELLLFFACKNSLAIMLQGNRLRVLLKEIRQIRRSLLNRVAFRCQEGPARNLENQENEPDDIENGTIHHELNESQDDGYGYRLHFL